MAAPATTARGAPPGYKMPDGFKTTIAFAKKANVNFWEKTVKPPSIEGGDKIDTTTMLNTAWRTSDARHLKTLSESTAMVAYDPDVLPEILTLVNNPGSITVHFPDNSTLDFYGFMSKFEIGDHKEGEMPEATVTICPTNWDPVNFVEVGPVFTAASGT